MISPSKNVVRVACSGVRPVSYKSRPGKTLGVRHTFDFQIAAYERFRHINGFNDYLNIVLLLI